MATGTEIIETAYLEAQKVIKNCLHPLGIRASAKLKTKAALEGPIRRAVLFLSRGKGFPEYPQVWARDSIITFLGASLWGDKEVKQGFKKTLETLARYQSELGCIPNNVDVHKARFRGPLVKKLRAVDYRATMDGNSWYAIGHYVFFQQYGDRQFLKKYYPSIKKALLWLQYQDSDNCGLIESQQSSDWEDLFGINGAGLLPNVLFFQALKSAGKIAKLAGASRSEARHYQTLSENIKKEINKRLWFDKKTPYCSRAVTWPEIAYWKELHKKSTAYKENGFYYRPYVAFLEYGDWFDSLGNLLAIIFEAADVQKRKHILDFTAEKKVASPYPIKAIFPSVKPGDKDWHDYYKMANLNTIHRYHNGGIWPFIGGFYVAALVKAKRFDEAKEGLVRLAELNKLGIQREWEFNEWFHGESGEPMGVSGQAWSAGMYIFAYEAVKRKDLIFF